MSSFIFLPDISGFTDFVNQTEIRHSRHIISELLELLIDSNEIGLELAEIEGDALFFYKHKHLPSSEETFRQVCNMLNAFHRHLKSYEHNRICKCGACSTAHNLTVKFFAHSGDFNFIEVKGSSKPYGPEVIQAHRLMKNSIPFREYLLVTDALKKEWSGLPNQKDLWTEAAEVYDKLEICYHFLPLTQIVEVADHIPSLVHGDLIDKPLKVEGVVDRPVEEVFELLTNLNYRNKWVKDVDEFKWDPDELNQVGAKHVCVINGNEFHFETVTKSGKPDEWIFGERTKSIKPVSSSTNYFILKPDEKGTVITIENHTKGLPVVGWLLRPFFQPLIKKQLRKTIEDIENALYLAK